ncbi:MBL fold metallo-hydrolase [Paenibacillus sediminis]|uniref:Glyoxylase-like metal-dependent hydrolase (Beta-lactamase superfamily II) n=1 Tax=Paenibacillus sediminis TaxID=664909 RepID=A0ABS4H1X6_9BACL|nr:MBL fold metallo-hydrolase [Paenibacillus sediminis]MBP1936528.1 glyoxylase-like metal-dependent hydrolase (beta-lactamase superfamily II) [Paenibacillus sediminis]
MRVTNGVEMLEISSETMGRVSFIHPTLIWDNEMAILIDTGYSRQLPKFREAFENANVPFGKLSKIIITHQDLDHIGSLSDIVSESSREIEVLANEVEKPYIEGDKRILRLTPEAVAKAEASIPSDVPAEWRKAFLSVLENPPKGRVDRIITDGEELPYGGGIVVINTPGHTPGHISLYHKPSKTLIAGDAMVVRDNELQGPDPQFALDKELAIESLKKFTQYDIEAVICYHGGLYKGDANRRIAEIING